MKVPLFRRKRLFGWYLIAIILFIFAVYVVGTYIGAFIVALFFYYGARPLHRRLKKYIHPTLSAGASVTALLIPVLILLSYLLFIGSRELTNALEQIDSGRIEEDIDFIDYEFIDTAQQALATPETLNVPQLVNLSQNLFEFSVQYLDYFTAFGLQALIAVITAFYLLRDDHHINSIAKNKLYLSDKTIEFLEESDRDFQIVFFGNILNAVLAAAIGAITFTLIDIFFLPDQLALHYPVLIGFACGLGSLIPVVGMKIVYIPVALYLAGLSVLLNIPGGFVMALIFFAVAFIIVDTIPDFAIRPYISGRNVHVGLILLAYIFGPIVFGWYGLFLGPMLLILGTNFFNIIFPLIIRENHSLFKWK